MFDEIVWRWDRWIASGNGGKTLLQWARASDSLAGWTVDELRSPVSGGRADRMQAALVARAQNGDDEATMTLVVQFHAALRRMATGRRRRRTGSWDEVTGDVISAFTEVVLTHDLVRRPERIAANLVRDTRQRLTRGDRSGGIVALPLLEADRNGVRDFREARPFRKLRQGRLIASDPSAQPEVRAGALDLEASVAIALDTLGGSEESIQLTRELAFRAWFLGQTNAAIAAELGLDPAMVRTRLCRLRSLVREHHQSDAA